MDEFIIIGQNDQAASYPSTKLWPHDCLADSVQCLQSGHALDGNSFIDQVDVALSRQLRTSIETVIG
jgi:hypothetical protein